ncbi:hypothetical protein RF55_7450 [Lasius niger]|uniref:Uncharacterized protein n=1 Tax=Lasius niger TaxID=67767 RepID=A0A0J7KQC4_LASNI|nr:hypothetical protein RF55_7450 [Lasius niger]
MKKEIMEMEEDRKEEEEEDRKEKEGRGRREGIHKRGSNKTTKRGKKGKAPGENGIENKAWKLMPREIRGVSNTIEQNMKGRRNSRGME